MEGAPAKNCFSRESMRLYTVDTNGPANSTHEGVLFAVRMLLTVELITTNYPEHNDRSRTQPGAEIAATILTKDVLELFQRSTKYVPPSLQMPPTEKDLQVFEVLSAYLMTLVQPDFDWRVTPLQRDGGLDFLGEKRLFPLRGYEDFKSFHHPQYHPSTLPDSFFIAFSP